MRGIGTAVACLLLACCGGCSGSTKGARGGSGGAATGGSAAGAGGSTSDGGIGGQAGTGPCQAGAVSCGGGSGSAKGGAAGTEGGTSGGAKAGSGGSAGSGAAGAGGSLGGGGSAAGGVGGSSGGSPGAAGIITVRVANFSMTSGWTAGRSFDIYDDMYAGHLQPSVSGTPIIAGLAYGTVSSYVRTRFFDLAGTSAQLVLLPAGSPPTDTADAQLFWGGTDDGSHPQLTIAMWSELSSSGVLLSSLVGWQVFVEKGQDSGAMGPLAPAPPAGQGEYLVNPKPVYALTGVSSSLDYFFFVDNSCTPALNGSTLPGLPLVNPVGTLPPNDFSQFAAAPGTHSLSIVAWDTGTAIPACGGLLASEQGTTTVSVSAGQQVIMFVYGSLLTDLHLLAAPIAP